MKALIAPNDGVQCCTSWTPNPDPLAKQKYLPVMESIPNGCRVAQVADNEFEVALPMFWVECSDNVVADQWYYNLDTQQILQIPAPPPYPQ